MYCSYLAWGTPWTEEPGKLSPWGHKIRTWLSKETTTTIERSVIDLGNRLMKRDFLSLSFSSPALTQFLSSLHFASSPSSLFCLLIFFPKLLPWETSKVLSFFLVLQTQAPYSFLKDNKAHLRKKFAPITIEATTLSEMVSYSQSSGKSGKGFRLVLPIPKSHTH